MGIFRRLGRGEKHRQVVVIGLDGTPFSYVQRLLDQGEMPNFKKLLEEGSFKRMDSVVPCVSSVAWSSFMTGKNPAKHGIYGFVDRKPGSYEVFIPTASHMVGPRLWSYLSDQRKRVFSMNVPVTYPPKSVNGILIGGFLCTNIDKIAYPPSVSAQLKAMNYRIDVDAWQARESLEKLLEDVNDTFGKRVETLFHFYKQEPWDFFIAHIMETDRLHHFLWEHMEKGDPRYAPAFVEFYRRMDGLLGQVRDRIGEDTTLIVLSDHGFCTLKKEVFLNHWLQEKGWLKFKTSPPKNLTDLHPDTKAYSLIPGRIFVNLRGREPAGSVEPGEAYERVRRELADQLLEMTDPDTGERIIEKVVMREEVYRPGRRDVYERAADLFALPYDGYDLKGNVNKTTLTEKSALVGMHTFYDAMLYIRGEEIVKEDLSIVDLMPTILQIMGVPIPAELDGVSCIRRSFGES